MIIICSSQILRLFKIIVGADDLRNYRLKHFYDANKCLYGRTVLDPQHLQGNVLLFSRQKILYNNYSTVNKKNC